MPGDVGHLGAVFALQQGDDLHVALAGDLLRGDHVGEIGAVGLRGGERHAHLIVGDGADGDLDRHAAVGLRGERLGQTCHGRGFLSLVEVVAECDDGVLRLGLQTGNARRHPAGGQLGDVVLQRLDDLAVALVGDQTVFDHLPVVEILGCGNDLHVGALVRDVRHGDLIEGEFGRLLVKRRGEDLRSFRIAQTAAGGGDGPDAQNVFRTGAQVAEGECRSRRAHLGLNGDLFAGLILLGEPVFVAFGIGYGIPHHLEGGGSRRGHRHRRFGEHRAALLFYIVAVATAREGE